MISLFLSSVLAQSNGNCVSQTINFDPLRMYALGVTEKPQLDVSTYDMTIDYGAQNANFSSNGVELKLTRGPTGTGIGVGLSTTRYFMHGRFTVTMRAIANAGAVSTFITMSDVKDEIDWELIGPSTAYTNVFYKGIPEFGAHATNVNSPVSGLQTYTIDWNSKRLIWQINGQTVRTYNNDANAVSPMTPAGQRWYPNTPSRVQIAVWDACTDGQGGTCSWASGPISWPASNALTALYQSIQIECYDSNDNIVPKWPLDSSNPDRKEAPSDQKTQAAGPLVTIVPTKPGGNGAEQPTVTVASLPTDKAASSSGMRSLAELAFLVLLF
ncbi:concanavalin A-like lectin/glucanase domain-containing protein [Gorgonomyces haynaldii]|nr:concanavalin A-like lectin/glucanase domain-containing protein [Gorgonomyces haynaldii]